MGEKLLLPLPLPIVVCQICHVRSPPESFRPTADQITRAPRSPVIRCQCREAAASCTCFITLSGVSSPVAMAWAPCPYTV